MATQKIFSAQTNQSPSGSVYVPALNTAQVEIARDAEIVAANQRLSSASRLSSQGHLGFANSMNA